MSDASKQSSGFQLPEGFNNAAARMPVFSMPNGKVAKQGTKTAILHGLFLGAVNLPSKQVDDKGNKKPWTCYVIELKSEALCKASAEDEEEFIAPPGTRVLITETPSMSRFRAIGTDPREVNEVFVQLEMGKNADGQNLWLCPLFAHGNPIPRMPGHKVVNLFAPVAANGSHPQLPASGTVNAFPGDDVPFA
jgi:hypothetical protein